MAVDVHARLAFASLQLQSLLEPLALSPLRLGDVGELSRVHRLAEEVKERIGEALRDVRGAVRAEAEAFLRDEVEGLLPFQPGLWRRGRGLSRLRRRAGEEDHTEFVQFRRRHGKLVEVVLEVVTNNVGGRTYDSRSRTEQTEGSSHHSERGLPLLGPLRGPLPVRTLHVSHRGQATPGQPRPELWSRVGEEVARHVVEVRGLVDGDGLHARGVERGPPWPAAFGRAPEAVGLQLTGDGALTIEVHRVEGGR